MEGPYDIPEKSSDNNNNNVSNNNHCSTVCGKAINNNAVLADANIEANSASEAVLMPFPYSYLHEQDNDYNNSIIVNADVVNNNIGENFMPLHYDQFLYSNMGNNNNNSNNDNAIVAYENVSDNGIKGNFRGMPVGYRFMPNDEELVNYLKHKIEGFPLPLGLIHDVDIYKFHPQELTGEYELIGEREWYFFTPRNRISPNGSRPSRKASNGYWKPTGSEKEVPNEESPVGVRMSLDYYEFANTEIQKRKQSSGTRTDWKMHEYIVKQYKDNGNEYRKKFHALAICKIYKKKAKNDEDEPAAGTSSSVPKKAPIQSQEPSSYGFQPISRFEEQAYWTQMMITANNLLVPQATTYAELVNNEVTNVQPVPAQIVEDQRDNSCPDSQRQNDDSCPDNEHQNDDSGLYCIVHSSRSWNKRLEKNPN